MLFRYCNGHKVTMGFGEHWDYSGASHLRELHILLKKVSIPTKPRWIEDACVTTLAESADARGLLPCLLSCPQYLLIRREKTEVLKQLPSKRRQTVTLDVPAARLSKLKKQIAEHDALEGDLTRGAQDPHLTRMFQLTGEAKVASVCEYINELIEANIKFLLFGHHIAVLDHLEHFIRNHKMLPTYIRIDGSTPAVKRNDFVQQFQDDVDCKIALLSITAAGTGLTLTSASHVVMAELNWTPATLVQAEDRVHRIGQNEVSRGERGAHKADTRSIGILAGHSLTHFHRFGASSYSSVFSLSTFITCSPAAHSMI
jgi:hypothetical protein